MSLRVHVETLDQVFELIDLLAARRAEATVELVEEWVLAISFRGRGDEWKALQLRIDLRDWLRREASEGCALETA